MQWKCLLSTRVFATLSLVLFFAMVPQPCSAQGSGVYVNRIEINSPWTGFYNGHGVQYSAKAVVHSTAPESLRGATVQFIFFDGVGPRETFNVPLPVLQAGGTLVVESPSWWDYSRADIGVTVNVIGQGGNTPLTTRKLGLPK